MVGFGSSLRISRRRGWESAYLDYESLKLLLTHIEAVYEETRHLADRADSAAAADGGAGGGGFGLGVIGVPHHGHGRGGGGGGEDRHVSALGHANFHFMETDDDMENHAHPHPHGAVGDMRSGRGSRVEGDDEDDDKKRDRQDQQKRQQETPGDYRDELFLESDSDFAYMSVGEEEVGSDMDDDDDDSIGHHHNVEAGNMAGRMAGHASDHGGMRRSAGVGGYEYNNSADEDAEDEPQKFNYGTTADASTTQQPQQEVSEDIWRQQQMKDEKFQYGSGGADSRNFGSGQDAAAEHPDDAMANDATREEILAEDDAYLTDTSAHGEVIGSAQESRYVYEPLSQIQSESSALLRHSSRKNVAVEESTSFFSIFGRMKKEEDTGRDRNKKVQQQQQPKAHIQGSAGVFANFGRSVVVGDGAGASQEQRQIMSHQPYQQERIIPTTRVQSNANANGDASPRKRRVRMKRTKRRKRSRRKRRVPIHILIAHSKARAITERFLGLLRAEVEKVTLFAHARMGELADTVGSLRFPSYDDGTFGNKGDYPLSDGGIHPSASSSDEFGRTSSWSDSSSEKRDDERIKMRLEQKMNTGGTNRGPRRSVAAVAASVTKRRSSLRRTSDNQVSPHQGVPGYPTLTSEQDLALKQIQHAEQLRMARPTFQRVSVLVPAFKTVCTIPLRRTHLNTINLPLIY